MKRLICRLRGHQPVRVRRVLGTHDPFLLRVLDREWLFTPDPDGDHAACVRCRSVLS